MSDQAQMEDLARRTALVATWERAHEALARFCRGQGRMSIPVQPTDDDLIITAMLKRGELVEEMQLHAHNYAIEARAADTPPCPGCRERDAALDRADAELATLRAELLAVASAMMHYRQLADVATVMRVTEREEALRAALVPPGEEEK